MGRSAGWGQGGTPKACSACGKQLASTADNNQDWKRCGRCKQGFYCGKACQVEHWKRGGHKQACTEPMDCCICLHNDGPPLPIQGGCACRGAAGCAHVSCRITAAEYQRMGYHTGWIICTTCNQKYTGPMHLDLAKALWARLKGRSAEDPHRLAAQNNLAIAYTELGHVDEAEPLYRDNHATWRRVHGPNHAQTLSGAGNLGVALLAQNKYSDAETLFRDTLERQREVLGPEHESTLSTASTLAIALQQQGKHAEAVPVMRDTLAAMQRVLCEGHTNILSTTGNLALGLASAGQHAEAVALGRSALPQAKRTLGPDHPSTLVLARTLAITLSKQGQAMEAETLFKATLATQQRVLDRGHPDTQLTARAMEIYLQ